MKKRVCIIPLYLLIIFFTLCCSKWASGQGLSQTIRGNISDQDTKMPLIGANVSLMDSDPLVGTITDVNGNFIIPDIPVGRQTLEISYVGYNNKIVPNILKFYYLSTD